MKLLTNEDDNDDDPAFLCPVTGTHYVRYRDCINCVHCDCINFKKGYIVCSFRWGKKNEPL